MNANLNLKKILTVGSVTAMVIGVLTLVILTLHSCGGDSSGDGSPVYDENGNCLNCGNGDGYVSSADSIQPSGDNSPTYADGKPIPQSDTEPYVCPVKEPPKVCILYTDTYCAGFSLDGSLVACGGPEDTTKGQGCGCSMAHSPEQVNCKTDYECQLKPQDAWPPCVCWEFCGFFGEWDCPASVWKLTFLPDEGDGYCHFSAGGAGTDALGKPGDPNPRYPLDGEPESSYILSPDGQTLTELTSMVTCTKL